MSSEEIIAKSQDIMRQVRDQIGETVGLGTLVPGSGDGVVWAAVFGTSGFSYHLEVDFRFPIHTSAPGKAMMAYLSADERDAYYKHIDFREYTPGTITRRKDFEAELESVVEQGYSIDVSEQLEGCHCVGVPVFDASRAAPVALWITGPSVRLPVRRFEQIVGVLKKGSAEITSRLSTGRRSPNRDYINSVVGQAQDILLASLHEPPDIQQLARNLYVSYAWFRKAFKEATGESPMQYHLSRRMERAGEMLRRTDLSIRRITEELGFKNQNHFSALFKRKTGLSPSAFRTRS